MAFVFAQPGIVVDWDWASELTAWSSDDTRVGALIGSCRLTRRPADELQATLQARRWLRTTAAAEWQHCPPHRARERGIHE
jgi:hypothetical protein